MNSFRDKPPADLQGYLRVHQASLRDREPFWRAQAERLRWIKQFETVVVEDFTTASVGWFVGGRLNAAYNALDLQIERGHGAEPAVVYLTAEDTLQTQTYAQLADKVRRLAGGLAGLGLRAGDRAVLYLVDGPETIEFVLACARLGVTYVPVPARYSAEQTAAIAAHCQAKLLVVGAREPDPEYLKRTDALLKAVTGLPVVDTREPKAGAAIALAQLLDRKVTADQAMVAVDAEHPLLLFYANSVMGVPRGTQMATGGYLVQAAATFDAIFRMQLADTDRARLYSALDLASAAGQCHGLWGPLLCGDAVVLAARQDRKAAAQLTQLLGAFSPLMALTTPDRLVDWRGQLERTPLQTGQRFSLVASCSDILSPRLMAAAATLLTRKESDLLNLWIQSEAGAALLCTYPSAELNRPGSIGLPFPGIEPEICNDRGNCEDPQKGGHLSFRRSWPAMIRGIWGQPERFHELYFTQILGRYTTRDAARADPSGFYWFMGRRDEVIKVRGFSLRTSEVESVLHAHPGVGEAAAVGVRKEAGDLLVAFVVAVGTPEDRERERALERELTEIIERRIGVELPCRFIFVRELPRSGTGKTARRVLRRIASGELEGDDDLGHVANPACIDELVLKMGR